MGLTDCHAVTIVRGKKTRNWVSISNLTKTLTSQLPLNKSSHLWVVYFHLEKGGMAFSATKIKREARQRA